VALLIIAGGCVSLPTETEIAAKYPGRPGAGFLETATVKVGEIETRYARKGKGEPVLMIHGFPETLQGWRRNVPALAEHFDVIAPDLPGCGKSGKPFDFGYTPGELADFLSDFLEELGVEKAHVVGTDTGMGFATGFAGRFPEKTKRLVLCAGTIYPEDINSWEIKAMTMPVIGRVALYGPFLGVVVRKGLQKGFTDRGLVSREMYEECLAALKAPGGRPAAVKMMKGFGSDAEFLKKSLLALEMPVLIIFADSDCYFSLEAGQRLARTIKGSEFRVIEGCGHFLQEEKAGEFNKLVIDFLRKGVVEPPPREDK
jgi:pimeloyl-ACP methyl ester carboxylesterase